MLIGEYCHAVDSKGRVIFPVKLREALGENFYITRGLDGCLNVYPAAEWDRLKDELNQLPRSKSRDIQRYFFSGACEGEPDKQGRVLIPASLRTHAALEKDVMLIGGSRIAYYLAKMLTESGMHVKIIEADSRRCIELARELPKVRIIHGDGTDHELLIEEGIRRMNACIALTGMDEGNMVLSLYAMSEGVQKVIPKINKKPLLTMADGIQLNSGISPNQLMADVIISYVRALGQSGHSAIRTLYKLVDGRVEAMEFAATDNASVIGIPLCELKLKKNLLLAGIVRGSHVIYPGANDQIHPGDIVIVVTTNLYISTLDGILEE